MGGVLLDDTVPESKRQNFALEVAKKYMPETTMAEVKQAWLDASGIPGSMRMVAMRELCKNLPNIEEVVHEYDKICQVDYYGLSKIRPEAKKVLAELSKKYNIGLMANQGPQAIDHLVDAGILEYFSHQKMSHHVGLAKPDPEFYRAIFADTGSKPEESVNIDDNWFRGCVPGKKLGMKTILFKGPTVPFPEDANPDFAISRLDELLEIF